MSLVRHDDSVRECNLYALQPPPPLEIASLMDVVAEFCTTKRKLPEGEFVVIIFTIFGI